MTTATLRGTHAAYLIIGDMPVIVYGKTTKTACGRRAATDRLVPRNDATCPDCIEQIAIDRHKMAVMEAVAQTAGMTSPPEYADHLACRWQWLGNEIGMSDCQHGCKIHRCRHCERDTVVHNSTYGCRREVRWGERLAN